MTRSTDSRQGTTIVEILGLAGSGKSTAWQRLQDSWDEVLPTYRVDRRLLLGAILRVSYGTVAREGFAAIRDPTGGFQGLRLAIHMDAMLRDLSERRFSGKGLLFLDQGPIFNCVSASRLADLGHVHDWVPSFMREQLLDRLDFLESIVFLDAEPRILLDRIQVREQQHQIKGRDESTMLSFLEDYRARYTRILDEIGARRELAPLHLDTGQNGPEEILELIREHIRRRMEGVPVTDPSDGMP